jgi:hypothetical protein
MAKQRRATAAIRTPVRESSTRASEIRGTMLLDSTAAFAFDFAISESLSLQKLPNKALQADDPPVSWDAPGA